MPFYDFLFLDPEGFSWVTRIPDKLSRYCHASVLLAGIQ
jgi:hypothetical protein